MNLKIGHGFDVHRLTENRKLILCGVDIPYSLGLLGHSDGDVAVHALIDAILGALGESDIGNHFPDTDSKFKNICSLVLLKQVISLMEDKGYFLSNADLTVIAQKPKLAGYLNQMKKNLSDICKTKNINIKATTTEGLGFEGRGEGISAHSVVLISKITTK